MAEVTNLCHCFYIIVLQNFPKPFSRISPEVFPSKFPKTKRKIPPINTPKTTSNNNGQIHIRLIPRIIPAELRPVLAEDKTVIPQR